MSYERERIVGLIDEANAIACGVVPSPDALDFCDSLKDWGSLLQAIDALLPHVVMGAARLMLLRQRDEIERLRRAISESHELRFLPYSGHRGDASCRGCDWSLDMATFVEAARSHATCHSDLFGGGTP